ncbi:magnesium-protoporphyrin IX monomethylester (oxidative) cyclase [Monoraphidium neglectum]|uniref:magnesium-protoporphyrin IX monomethyl ester (oxidative) cyclase n=1 Tax=Monoraphidium neglectum TaxID=145388 RepID=A0A0D2NKB9_9CHLO|nr:magnesium-protoporphyrin IX monomethylester (oxidative) cyclase [Monoraphidium neglectum]KIZ05236.1 magnesium-protoporphyrin IX monomethylester (oxidative) cyclase [Monoraphidium neglectum]|eukprot:XP_013904255.1 magnesium-protoporphyrin IX monomethylester (oxidative) cyclase [Monoraphidium neglectum]
MQTARPVAAKAARPTVISRGRVVRARAAAAAESPEDMGFKTMRDGVKVAADETLLTPRFYTTDFDEMEQIFSQQINPNLNMAELDAMLAEFRNDYNQRHFVRNETFKAAAENITGPTRKIFIEFLERSCTAEFSGFLLYKELGRRLKDCNPCVAEIFMLLSRDEARHAGFLNKALSDFNLALDLGFLTKNRRGGSDSSSGGWPRLAGVHGSWAARGLGLCRRKYTFFKPKFIIYATYLSEKIGYWRYICIYRHLQRNPDSQIYPLFEYFENWCQDENRHGDFLAAVLKAKPDLLEGTVAKLWSRFFCLSVYITMYLNDNQRSAFYESIGMNTKLFNQHVIIETNKSTERLFPAVPDVESPEFFMRMDRLVEYNSKLVALGKSDLPAPLQSLARLPIIERMVAEIFQIFIMKPKDCGSVDMLPAAEQAQVMY